MPRYDIGFGPVNGPGEGGVMNHVDNSLLIPNLQLSLDYVKDPVHGGQTAVVTATWDAPALGEDLGKTTKNKVVAYWVSDRQGTVSQPNLTYNAERKVTTRTVVFRGLNLHTLMDFRVRARTGGGQYGPYTSASINTAQDTTPPNQPSTPVVSGLVRGIRIVWDGNDYLGHPQPNDFDRCEIEVSTINAVSGFGIIGTFPRTGGDHTYQRSDTRASQYWVRLRAFDKTQNASPYSAVGTATSLDYTAALDAEGGSNSVKNASFEDVSVPQSGAPLYWKIVGTLTSYRSNAWAQHNAASQELSNASGDSYIVQTVPCLPNTQYSVSAYLKKVSGGTFSDRTLVVVESGGASNQAQLYSGLPVGVTRLVSQFTTGPNSSTFDIRLYGSSGDAFYDAVQAEAGPNVTAFSPRPGEIGFGTIGTAQMGELSVTTALLANNSVHSEKVLNGAINAAKVALAAIDADPNGPGHLAIGAVYTHQVVADDVIITPALVAGAVTASKLTIGSLGDNKVKNSGFEDSSPNLPSGYICDGWQNYRGSSHRQADSAGAAAGGAYCSLDSNSPAVISDPFPVEENRYYYGAAQVNGVGMYVRLVTGTDPTVTPDNGGAYTDMNYVVVDSKTSPSSTQTSNTNGWQLFEGQALVPAGHRWGRMVLYCTSGGTGKADAVVCRKVNGSTMITDGAVYTDKVSARGIVADKIAAGTITANISIDSPTINGGTISGADIIGYSRIISPNIETGDWYDYRIALQDTRGVSDTIRWYSPGTSATDRYGPIRAELRGKMGSVHQYGIHLNGNVEIGNQNSSVFQTGPRVAVGTGVPTPVRVRARSNDYVVFDSTNSVRINFDSAMVDYPTYVGVMFLDFACVFYVDSVDTTGFTLHARRVNASTDQMNGVGCHITWFVEQFNVNVFAGSTPAF